MRLLVANLDKDKPHDKAYVRRLRRHLRRNGGGVLALVEAGHGVTSTRLVGVRTRLRHRARITVGEHGRHNGVARAWARVDRTWVMVLAAHGLHRKTAGQAAHDAYYETLAADQTRHLSHDGKPWLVLADFNDDPARVATVLGGVGYKAPGDVMGAVVSGLRVVGTGTEDIGRSRGWTGHYEFWIDVTATKENP